MFGELPEVYQNVGGY